ncbi:MAG TPA: 4'-phosphopantetheinyl transferase superfamily protein [Elusimicrobiales bacterium]|nr:4'-phosphopantetheinyl transferase superfamily protein [Elusimicrobiales bacterium]
MGFVTEIVSVKGLPKADEFLNDKEFEKYCSLKFEKRKTDWLAGRFAAKKVILKALCFKHLGYKDISIENDTDRRPYFKIDGKVYPNVLSISHCENYGLAAVGNDDNSLLGIDLEIITERPKSWIEEVFNPKELTKTDSFTLTKLWTQKEAVLKALGLGLSADLYQIMIIADKPVFLGKILRVWQEKGSKQIKILSKENPKGFITSTAYDL